MKDLDPISSHKSPEELKETREAKKTKLLAQMVFKRGLPVWQFNEKTKVLDEAEFKTTIFEMSKHKTPTMQETVFDIGATQDTVHRVLDKQPDCIYFQALNRKNALKKLENLVK